RTSGGRLLLGRDPSAQCEPEGRHPGGPLPPRGNLDARDRESVAGRLDRVRARDEARRRPAATVAPPAPPVVVEPGVVERAAQEGQAAALGALVLEHRGLLGAPRLLDSLVACGVVGPARAGRLPTALDATHRAVDVEDL